MVRLLSDGEWSKVEDSPRERTHLLSDGEVKEHHEDEDEGTSCVERCAEPLYLVPYIFAMLLLAGFTVLTVCDYLKLNVKTSWPKHFFKHVNGTNTGQPDWKSFGQGAEWATWILVQPCCLVMGVFLAMNGDLIVTHLRFAWTIKQIGKNNKRFEDECHKNGNQIRDLKATEKAFEALEDRFERNVQKANSQVQSMEREARESLSDAAGSMVRCYSDSRTQFVGKDDLERIFKDFKAVFGELVEDWNNKARILADTIKAHSAYQQKNGLRLFCVARLVECAVVAKDSGAMSTDAMKVLDRELLSRDQRWALEDQEHDQYAKERNEEGHGHFSMSRII